MMYSVWKKGLNCVYELTYKPVEGEAHKAVWRYLHIPENEDPALYLRKNVQNAIVGRTNSVPVIQEDSDVIILKEY